MSLIAPAVQTFRTSYPEVSLKIQTRHTAELLNALLTRELDLGVALNPPALDGPPVQSRRACATGATRTIAQ